ncbi:uncharacterized protein LOC130909947 [Corythoichthys intestinalis]|uniref:uncharacterized protein LOC130909947 n=1 Tax=Corythoichthys intestinalis TaxID=161448 RepID=UPI0025A6667A|nr:uncharacterized protein LOC130909947 [Corythoichthys intestinalis]
MSKGSTANNDAGCPAESGCCDSHKNVCEERRGPITTKKQEVRRRSAFATSAPSLTSCFHQRRWSADCCHDNSSPVIIVKKNVREPQPPERGVSLLRCHTPSRDPRRYSSPITGIVSMNPSCSSIVQTSAITGHDPLGWKLRPKSSTSSNRAQSNRLSLQIPLPEANFRLANTSPTTPLDPATIKSKPSRRHHSDSLAFLRSTPAVTLEELRDVRLRPIVGSDEPDDVFGEAYAQPGKKPPAVPLKSPLARKIAQLIAHSWKQKMCAAPKNGQEEIIYSVIQPKAKTQQVENRAGPANTQTMQLLRAPDH